MENISLLRPENRQDNTNKAQIKGLPCFIVIQKIKIPCANPEIGKRILASFKGTSKEQLVTGN